MIFIGLIFERDDILKENEKKIIFLLTVARFQLKSA